MEKRFAFVHTLHRHPLATHLKKNSSKGIRFARIRLLFEATFYDYRSAVYIADEWEIPREQIKLTKELGNGSFGMVYEGEATNLVEGQMSCRVAVKVGSLHMLVPAYMGSEWCNTYGARLVFYLD